MRKKANSKSRRLRVREKEMLEGLKSTRWKERTDALYDNFGHSSHPKVVDAVVHALSDRSWLVLVQACSWIEHYPEYFRRHPRVRTALEQLMKAPRPQVASGAGRALGKLGAGSRKVAEPGDGPLRVGELARLSDARQIARKMQRIHTVFESESSPDVLCEALKLFLNNRVMPDPLVALVVRRFDVLNTTLPPGGSRCVLVRALADAAKTNKRVQKKLQPLTHDEEPHVAWWAKEVLGLN